MISFQIGSIILESIPSFFILLTLYLHDAKVFKRTFHLKPTVSHLIMQKDLFEYGTVQLAVGAVASYLEGYSVSVAILIGLVIIMITVPYLTMTVHQGNRLGWVKVNAYCVIYIGMMLAISIGIRFVEQVSTTDAFVVIPIILSAIIFIGEFRRSS